MTPPLPPFELCNIVPLPSSKLCNIVPLPSSKLCNIVPLRGHDMPTRRLASSAMC